MDKKRIVDLLSDSNPWGPRWTAGGLPRTDYLEKIGRFHKTRQVIAVTGVRRSGKSTLMRQYADRIAEEHGKKSVLYVNFDEAGLGRVDLEGLLEIFDAYRENVWPKGKAFVFLDEAQKVKGWERFARTLHERGEADVFVSGSTGKLIGREYGTVLTGRHLDVGVFPFSFEEVLSTKGISGRKESLLRKNEVVNALSYYLKWGGFPKVVLSDEKKELLSGYFDDIITRDVVERYKIRQSDKVRQLAAYFLSNVCALHSFNKLGVMLGLSVDTVSRFFGYLEEANLVFSTRKFSFSYKEQIANPRKVYAIDNGLWQSVGFGFSQNLGKAMENAVAIQLKRLGKEVYYWKEQRTQREVDFVIKEGNTITEAIQVSYEGDLARESKALDALEKELSPKKITVIGWDEPKTSYNNAKLSDWLLGI